MTHPNASGKRCVYCGRKPYSATDKVPPVTCPEHRDLPALDPSYSA